MRVGRRRCRDSGSALLSAVASRAAVVGGAAVRSGLICKPACRISAAILGSHWLASSSGVALRVAERLRCAPTRPARPFCGNNEAHTMAILSDSSLAGCSRARDGFESKLDCRLAGWMERLAGADCRTNCLAGALALLCRRSAAECE